MNFKKTLVCSLVLVCGIFGTVRQSNAAVRDNLFIPFVQGFELCGDEVVISGDLHILSTFTQDRRGGIHVQFLAQPTSTSGVSLITGEEFIGVGATVNNFNIFLPNGTGTETVRSQVILIGNNGSIYVSLIDFHITIANGEVRVLFSEMIEAVCL